MGYKFTFQVKVRAAELTLETEKRNNRKLEVDLLYWEDALDRFAKQGSTFGHQAGPG